MGSAMKHGKILSKAAETNKKWALHNCLLTDLQENNR